MFNAGSEIRRIELFTPSFSLWKGDNGSDSGNIFFSKETVVEIDDDFVGTINNFKNHAIIINEIAEFCIINYKTHEIIISDQLFNLNKFLR